MEVGVADGRFSEHFLLDGQPKAWYMVEPFPNKKLQARYPASTSGRRAPRRQLEEMPTSWASRGIGTTSTLRFFKAFSLDKAVLDAIHPESVDFVYLDGAHDYANVARELEPYYRMLRPGGMLAGHDYCKYDERPLACRGCADVPACVKYTEYGVRHGKGDRLAANQWGVVKAVQEWLVRHPELEVYHTIENFTRTSLAQDGMDYDLVITNTYNPSWYVFKPNNSVVSPTPKNAGCDSTSRTAGAQKLVVLFSYNFGNYRGEISRYRKQTQKFSYAYDRFFFTDLVDVARPLADDGWILFKVSADDACCGVCRMI
jgi:hypothetical protein